MGEGKEKPVDNGNGKHPIINIKLDKSFLMALAALLGVGGVGYGQIVKPGTDDLEATRTGASIQINDAYQKSAAQVRKLAQISKRRGEDIERIYEMNEWLAASLAEVGKSHPAALRKIKRKAPEFMADGFGFEEEPPFVIPAGRRPAAVSADALDDESEILNEIEAMPEKIEFPTMDRIQAVQRRK